MCHQVYVTSVPLGFPRIDFHNAMELGKYTGDLALDRKYDFTYEPGSQSYLRGKWIGIVSSSTTSKLTLSEIRVYGSK